MTINSLHIYSSCKKVPLSFQNRTYASTITSTFIPSGSNHSNSGTMNMNTDSKMAECGTLCNCGRPNLPHFQARLVFADPGEDCKVCGVSQNEMEAEAERRAANRLYFMGITKLGYQKPVMEAVNPMYKDEPSGAPKLISFLPDRNNPDQDYGRMAEHFRYIDAYAGLVDGRNYGKSDRLNHQKLKHSRHPLGPETRFCVPITNNMNYGWWIRDKKCMDVTQWYKVRQRFPRVRGPMSKFVDEMAIHTPHFILF